ncbi:hypothetical protein GS3922_15520 [Geobacillus subterraneus]|uniref:Uncharacterized protein n=2 Tax=Geobacillus TaxID=129337 RepID=A0ABN4NJN6_9BACL|nr:hypothetical protein GS3922_15520 [Geobacillus subterraneus]OXB85077.1 hypothetical protein B9L21_15425 [Geobacillus uzenensis]
MLLFVLSKNGGCLLASEMRQKAYEEARAKHPLVSRGSVSVGCHRGKIEALQANNGEARQ